MATREQWHAVFISPGTFVSETTSRAIDKPDPAAAAKMATEIVERHGATPFGFQFVKYLEHDPIPDGRGGTLAVNSKELERTGTHYLGGRILTFDDLEQRADPKDEILRSDMQRNGCWVVVENTNSYRSVLPFEHRDVLLDKLGNEQRRGNDRALIEYRARKSEQRRVEVAVV